MKDEIKRDRIADIIQETEDSDGGIKVGKLIPLWEIVEKTFAEKGIKLSPRLTLVLCDKIAKEINEELGYSPPVKYHYVEETERRLKHRLSGEKR